MAAESPDAAREAATFKEQLDLKWKAVREGRAAAKRKRDALEECAGDLLAKKREIAEKEVAMRAKREEEENEWAVRFASNRAAQLETHKNIAKFSAEVDAVDEAEGDLDELEGELKQDLVAPPLDPVFFLSAEDEEHDDPPIGLNVARIEFMAGVVLSWPLVGRGKRRSELDERTEEATFRTFDGPASSFVEYHDRLTVTDTMRARVAAVEETITDHVNGALTDALAEELAEEHVGEGEEDWGDWDSCVTTDVEIDLFGTFYVTLAVQDEDSAAANAVARAAFQVRSESADTLCRD